MAKRTKKRDDTPTDDTLFDVASEPESQPPFRPGPTRYEYTEETSDTSDVLLILAVMTHHIGINAVEPSPQDLATIICDCEELGYDDLDKEMLKTMLKKAQIELLRRQLQG